MQTKTLSKKINRLFALEKWVDARALIEREIDKRGNEVGHWLLARLATTYYEQKNYIEAQRWLLKAMEMAPRCPLVLWDYAGTLAALGQYDKAIKTYVSLLRRGAPAIAKEECGEDLEWAIGLLTDCLFRIGVCLKHKERWEQAVNFFAEYEEVVRAGAKSIYKFLDLWKQLAELPQQEIPESSPALPEKRQSPAKVLASVSKEALSRLAA